MKAEIDVSVGDIIFYRLEPKSLPVNPERIWKARVEWSYARKCLFIVPPGFGPICGFPSLSIEGLSSAV